MRIAIVSAHYPPNFVSGGTLVPERLAKTLAARGHEVFVFAGEITEGEPDLLTRVERIDGIDITWVSVADRLRWDDDRNFESPQIQIRFADFLRRVRPEVVHLHTLQGLGASLVTTASVTGAAVVVTMHDMWWWCSRQFLVEENLRPCTTVVGCGVCPCAKDNDWLRTRNAGLAAHLSMADLVLAPSTPMLTLLAANGVDPDRLAVDENPAPESVRRAGSGTADGTAGKPGDAPLLSPASVDPVRFVFAGGPFPVKGGPLALQAARLLDGLPGWTFDLYGLGTSRGQGVLRARRRGRLPTAVRVLPRYEPDRAADVLAGYDVLVLSSVMLESYSLLTREALAAGCVVITGDNPGPVEAVQHGVNGLVVPRGDAEALADAMRSLVTDRALLRRLRPAPGAVALRSLADQAAGLEQQYTRILAAKQPDRATSPPAAEPAAGSPTGARPLQRVLLVSGISGAPMRYRGFLPAEALELLGVHVDVLMYTDQRIPARAAAADAVVLYRVPATDEILAVIGQVRSRGPGVPILFDVDDLIVDPGLAAELDPILTAVPGLDLPLYWQGVRRYRTTLEACDGYIGSTDHLCRRIGELTGLPTYRYANGVGRELARVSDAQLRRKSAAGTRRSETVSVGYFSGTNTHNEDWAHIEPAVARLMAQRPQVHLVVGGLLETGPALAAFADRISRLPLKPWYALPGLLADLDINLAPLQPGRTFNEAKSAIKFLEAALVATPTVASPSQPFREAIEDYETGLLADSEAEWFSALTALVDSPALRHRLGNAAREHVLMTLSPARQGYRYREILLTARDRVVRDGHREWFANWRPESLSEPFRPSETEFYGALEVNTFGRVRPAEQRGVRDLAHRYSEAATTMLAEQGALATARRAVAVLARLRRQGLTRLHR